MQTKREYYYDRLRALKTNNDNKFVDVEIRFIKGRLTFWDMDGKKYMEGDFKSMTPAPFPSAIVIFSNHK